MTLFTSEEAKSTRVEVKYFASPQRLVWPSLDPFDIQVFYRVKGDSLQRPNKAVLFRVYGCGGHSLYSLGQLIGFYHRSAL